jgi:predicted DNA-binding protein (MmcQ/YjbR family)
MDVAEYCLSKDGAEETYPFGDEHYVFKVDGKMFALCGAVESPDSINLKCDPVRAQILRQGNPEIIPGYHMNKMHWNTVSLKGNLPADLILELIDHSYDLVAPKLRSRG